MATRRTKSTAVPPDDPPGAGRRSSSRASASSPAASAGRQAAGNPAALGAVATVSGPARMPASALTTAADLPAAQRRAAALKDGAQQQAMAKPQNDDKPGEFGISNARHPRTGHHLPPPPDEVSGASTVSEDASSIKVGDGLPQPGTQALDGPLDRVRTDAQGRALTTNQGVPVGDNQNSLKAGLRGPTLMEDFILREKLTHFDHERIPERVVHARGSGAHGYFECDVALPELTRADLFAEAGKRTPVFVRFSTVAGERGSADTVRDTRGFAVKFYTAEGNWDLVGNNIPVFFIQDAMKFPDLVHAVKPEPHHQMPQASSAHDTFWDFVSLMPESMHHVLWVMSDRGIPRSYRTMQGFGVHTYRFVNADGHASFVKFHWQPVAGTHALVWDEAVRIAGADPDYHRRDLWEAIEAGQYPTYELALQVFGETEAERFSFDVLDPTKIVPEELVPLRTVGRLVLNRNPDNFFAETEQVAFCTAHVVPGIDFSNDPLLQGRIHSYVDTQLTRLGGPNFHEIPINAPVTPVHNNQRDGLHRQAIHRGRVSYEPNSLAGGCPFQAGMGGFVSAAVSVATGQQAAEGRHPAEDKLRGKPEKFADHYTQPQLFWRSQTVAEQRHIIGAFRFELSRVTVPAVRERVVSQLRNVDESLARAVAAGLGMTLPAPQARLLQDPPPAEVQASAALSMFARPGATPAAGRRVALLAVDGADGAALRRVQDALRPLGAMPRLVGLQLGPVRTAQGDTLEVDTSLETLPSALWDALVLPDLGNLGSALTRHPLLSDFIREQHRHCKPILALGETGAPWLESLGLPLLLHGERPDPALIVEGTPADDPVARFAAALQRHRHHERELDLLQGTTP